LDPAAAARRGKRGTGSAKARRKAARLAAVQALYQIDVAEARVETVIGEFVKERLGWEIDGDQYVAGEPQLFADIVRGTRARLGEIDHMIAAALGTRNSIERLEVLIRETLRAGAFELLAHHDTAPRIIISEYVDVARAFFAEREPALVNGVLDHIAHTLRPDDFNAPGA